MLVISQTNTLAYSIGMGLLWKTHPSIATPIATSFVLFPTILRGMSSQQGVSIKISSMGYHVPKPVMEPIPLRLATCGARRWSSGLSWLRFCMNIINLFSKSVLTFSSIFSSRVFLYLSHFL
jgi:hypothetical protein